MNTIRTGKQAPANTIRNLGMYNLWAKKYDIYSRKGTTVENGEGMLDKDATSHDDLFDAFRLSLQFWH
jgi:hypothetical protein